MLYVNLWQTLAALFEFVGQGRNLSVYASRLMLLHPSAVCLPVTSPGHYAMLHKAPIDLLPYTRVTMLSRRFAQCQKFNGQPKSHFQELNKYGDLNK